MRLKLLVNLFLIISIHGISNFCFAGETELFSKEITLVTVMSNTTKRGGHSSLIIEATEKVIFDPAGRVRSKLLKEKAIGNKVLDLENVYYSFFEV